MAQVLGQETQWTDRVKVPQELPSVEELFAKLKAQPAVAAAALGLVNQYVDAMGLYKRKIATLNTYPESSFSMMEGDKEPAILQATKALLVLGGFDDAVKGINALLDRETNRTR